MTIETPLSGGFAAQKGRRLRQVWMGTALAGALCVGAAVAWAAPVVSGQQIRDFTRITFEWPQATRIDSRMEGSQLLVTFDQKADKPDFARLLNRLPKIVKKADVSADGRTVTLTLNQAYRIRSFVSGRLNGVDLLSGAAAEAETPKQEVARQSEVKSAPAPAPIATPASDDAQKAAEAKKAFDAQKAAEKASAEKKAAELKAKADKEKKEAEKKAAEEKALAAKEKAEQEAKAKAPSPLSGVVPKAKPAAAEVKTEAPAPVAAPAVEAAPAAVVEEKPAAPAAAAVPSGAKTQVNLQAAPADATKLAVSLTRQGDGLLLNFPWSQRTAAAVFQRGDYFWIVFDQLAGMQLTNAEQGNGLLTEVQGGAISAHTVLRIKAPTMRGVKVQQTEGSMAWQVVLSPQAQWPETTPAIQAKTDSPAKAHLLVAALETAPAVSLPDPSVGDQILIVPSYTPGQGIAPARELVEMQLLASAQGLAIVPNVPDIAVSNQRNGLRIGTAEGLSLSPNLPSLGGGKDDGSGDTPLPSLFAASDWPSPKDRLSDIQARLTPLTAEPGVVGNEARRQLAQAYLANNMGAEALGELELIRADDLDYYIRERLSALSGLANFLMYRIGEAARDFAVPELQDNEEADYWRIALAELNGRSDELFDYPRFNARYIRQYTDELRRRLGIIAADRLVARNRYNESIKVLDGLNKANLVNDKIKPAVNYLMGETLARTGYPDKAMALWQPLTENLDDRYWRARAEFALLNLELVTGKINEEQAIPRLDRLRILWRDDPVELQALSQLSSLQLKNKHYRDALRTLRDITTSYPNTQEAFDSAQKMAETFVYLFNQDGAESMKPLEALALYYEFKDLTPVETQGDLMIRNLADRLAEVDLLDRAAALLEHQVRYRLQGEERSRVGARLALIYLLNRQPQPALDVLELTGYGANPGELQQTRALLTARALADLKEGDRAIALLEDDPSADAQLLKLDVYWDAGNWPDVARVGEAILSARRDPTAQLNESEMGALLKLAVAYNFEKDSEQLRYLRDYFSPLVQNNPHRDLFLFLTNDAPISPESIAQLAANINQMQSFLARWRTQIHEEGLSEAVK